jgi:hypothetical protein
MNTHGEQIIQAATNITTELSTLIRLAQESATEEPGYVLVPRDLAERIASAHTHPPEKGYDPWVISRDDLAELAAFLEIQP